MLALLLRQSLVSVLISLLGYVSVYADDHAAPPAMDDWIRGPPNRLEMRIRDAILNVDGQPAHAPSVFVSIKDSNSSEAMDVDGYYTFDSMPIDVEIALSAASASAQKDHWLGTVELGDSKVPAVETHTIDD
jgi:hypothetical protein